MFDAMAFSWISVSCPTWSKHMWVASLSEAFTVGGKVKEMKYQGSSQAWLKQSPGAGQEASFKQRERACQKAFMKQQHPATQWHCSAICPQQPISVWKEQKGDMNNEPGNS